MIEDSQLERINVVGTSGSGKTTLARELAIRLGLPCHEMDQLFWKPGWQESSDEELVGKVREITSGPRWVLDGNYTRTLPKKWARAQAVVWLDLPFLQTVFRVARRAVRRSCSGQEIWPGTGNRESLAMTFCSRDSVVWWAITTYWPNRRKYRDLMASPAYATLRFVRLRSSREVDAWLNTLPAAPRPGPPKGTGE